MKKYILLSLFLIKFLYSQNPKGFGECITYKDGISVQRCKSIAFRNAKDQILINYYAYKINYNYLKNKKITDSINNLFDNDIIFYKSYLIDSLFDDQITVECDISLKDNGALLNLLDNLKTNENILISDSSEINNKFKYSLLFGVGGTLSKFSNLYTKKNNYHFSILLSIDFELKKYITNNSEFIFSLGIMPYTTITGDIKLDNDIAIDLTNPNFNIKFIYGYKEIYVGLQASYLYFNFNKEREKIYLGKEQYYFETEKSMYNFAFYFRKYFFTKKLILDATIPFLSIKNMKNHNNYYSEIDLSPLFFLSLKYSFNL